MSDLYIGILIGVGITLAAEMLALWFMVYLHEDPPYNGGPYGGGSPDV